MTNNDNRNSEWSRGDINMLVDLAGRMPRLQASVMAVHLGRSSKGVQVKLSNLKTAVKKPHSVTANKISTMRNIDGLDDTRIEILRAYTDQIQGDGVGVLEDVVTVKEVSRNYLRNVQWKS